MNQLRCACYVRYSTDRQNPQSAEDQLRKCTEFAARQGWRIPNQHIYSDEALSGASSDRPALQRLVKAALSTPRPFDILLVEDTSRLSRNLADALRLIEQLNFVGVRVIAISQQIDTKNAQADVLLTVHGLVDSLYLKELAAKTHRGLESRVLRGLHAGGRCYGYTSITTESGVRLEVNQDEAAIVRRIFERSAAGDSLKTIALALNDEHIQAPRPREGRQAAGWCPTAIRAMLRNEKYIGRVVWNRTRFERDPQTHKRVSRPRPPEEWRSVQAGNLRIVPDELWAKVHGRVSWLKEHYGQGRQSGLVSRAAGSRYLFSGFLICGECEGNLIILSGHGKGKWSRYGCSRNFNRGTCENSLRVRQDHLEAGLLRELQDAVLQPEAIDYAIGQFEKELSKQLESLSGEMDELRHRKSALETELRRLTLAVAEGGHSTFLLEAIAEREKELRNLTDRLLSGEGGSIQAGLADLREFVHSRLKDVRAVLNADVPLARAELAKHVKRIIMRPVQMEDYRYYVAAGDWDLLGSDPQGWGGGGFECIAGP